MAFIPTGTFTRGLPAGAGNPDESPAGAVTLPRYLIDTREVTVADYRRCVEAGLCDPGWVGHELMAGRRAQPSAFCTYSSQPGNHPMTCVSWFEALRFCQCHGQRLPSEDEWERAARGDKGLRRFPWGDEPPAKRNEPVANLADKTAAARFARLESVPGYTDGYAVTAPVASFPAGRSPHGLHDTVGNVTEWTLTTYNPNAYWVGRHPHGLTQNLKVARGAAFDSDPATIRLTRRWPFLPWDRAHSLGFRCANSARLPPWAAVRRGPRPHATEISP